MELLTPLGQLKRLPGRKKRMGEEREELKRRW
jgi:hypothetical protein